jgi:hypothetical protein
MYAFSALIKRTAARRGQTRLVAALLCGAMLGTATGVVTSLPASAQTLVPATSINMRMLVVSADGTEPILAGIKSILDQLNVPYDVLIASQTPLTASTLSDGNGNGFYQGIFLTTGNLAYDAGGGNWQSALTADQWQTLWQYETTFKVRQSTLYTYPVGAPDNYCLSMPNAQGTDTNTTPVKATLTTAGKNVFSYLNPSNPVSIQKAWTYLAQPGTGGTLTPLLSTSSGNPIASICTYADGRQNLTITTDGNPDLIHTLSLGYGVINWVSKGVFLGERHVYMSPQPDDILIEDELWDVALHISNPNLTYRVTGPDYNKLIQWQSTMNAAHPNNAKITLEVAFNGVGASGEYKSDTLTSAVKKNNTPFRWISHTWDHTILTGMSYLDSTNELAWNDTQARNLRLAKYFKDSMVQPEISGLDNPYFLQAAWDFGIRYILSDTSQPWWNNPAPNIGSYSTYVPGLLIIPRYPTNCYYNVHTPAEWVDEYNYFYAPSGIMPYWDHNLSYAEILDKESDMWLRYLLKYSIDPVMFHQTNLYPYDGKNNVMGDLIYRTLAKYNAISTLPIVSLAQHDIGRRMASRMAYNQAGVSARLILGSTSSQIQVTAANSAANVPITGVVAGSTEKYGGQTISTVTVNAGSTVTVAGPAW